MIENSNWNKLSYIDKQAIEGGLSQLSEGVSFSYTDVRKEIETLFAEKNKSGKNALHYL